MQSSSDVMRPDLASSGVNVCHVRTDALHRRDRRTWSSHAAQCDADGGTSSSLRDSALIARLATSPAAFLLWSSSGRRGLRGGLVDEAR
jgi:hypothetical protein